VNISSAPGLGIDQVLMVNDVGVRFPIPATASIAFSLSGLCIVLTSRDIRSATFPFWLADVIGLVGTIWGESRVG
jgi:hypothetical protein